MKGLFLVAIILMSTLLSFSQNSAPVAMGETVLPDITLPDNGDTTYFINVLLNDFDPDGDAIRVCEVKNRMGQDVSISFSDSIISITMERKNSIEHGFEYRVCEVNDSVSISNWATLIVNPGYKNDLLVLRNDTITCVRGYDVWANVIANDYIGSSNIQNFGHVNDSGYIHYDVPFYSNNYYRRLLYGYFETEHEFADKAYLFIKFTNNQFYDSLNINNINARLYCHGHHFWDLETKSKFKVPNGSEKTSLFNNVLWVGGLDEENDLHMAAESWRGNGNDFYHGPVSDQYDEEYDKRWLHIWNLNRDDIDYHKKNWWKADYVPLPDILTWPGNGDLSLGQTEQIAPFEDHNNNGVYEPLEGDVPVIKGDQTLFFVFNDARGFHYDSQGFPLGIEVHAMAYAYDMPEDSALWSTIFLNYMIINRSDTTYHDTYMGFYSDVDLGYEWDDYIQSDVQKSMYFGYNGDPFDDLVPYAYGENPPAMGVMLLGGPYMDTDGIDNPKFDVLGNQICDESINGLNFGDTIIDNERLGMTNFFNIFKGGPSWSGYPSIAQEYYNVIRSKYINGDDFIYGGFGHITAGGVGPECRYMFPGDSDPCNWGTNGIPPNGGYNQPGKYWTEEQLGQLPSDRNGMLSSGPFILESGEVNYVDLALIWARAYDGNPWSSVELLKERASGIKQLFEFNENFFSGAELSDADSESLVIYPNPVSDQLRIKIPGSPGEADINIYNSFGHSVSKKRMFFGQSGAIQLKELSQGLYIIFVSSGKKVYSAKFIKK